MPKLNVQVFIFHDGSRAHLAQISEGVLKTTCIMVSVVCGTCSGPILKQGKWGRNQEKAGKYQGK